MQDQTVSACNGQATGTNRVTTAYPASPQPRGFTAIERPSSEALFRRARRHSVRVRLLRVLIPVIIVGGLSISALVVWLNPLRLLTDMPVSIGRISLSKTRMTMTEPKLPGFTRDGRRYELTAKSAAQDMTQLDVVNLEEPRAAVEMSDGAKITLQAALGIFDRKAGLLTLRKDILLSSTAGQEVRLKEAVVDVRTGNITTDQPVEVKMPQATLRANRAEVIKSGEVVRFFDGVSMVLIPDAPAGDNPAAPK